MEEISRQRKWQIEKNKLNLCPQCGKESIEGKSLCTACAEKSKAYSKSYHYKNREEHLAQVREWQVNNPNYQRDLRKRRIIEAQIKCLTEILPNEYSSIREMIPTNTVREKICRLAEELEGLKYGNERIL